jgi:hypothetical protein
LPSFGRRDNHAMLVVHGARGFCNVNIEAIMIEYIRRFYGHKRIAVVDTDCHHGDGTQDIYWNDPDTLCISIHQDGRTLYPGSGFHEEFGGPNAMGTTLNIPLPPRTSDEGFLYILENAILPILHDFKPDLVINSAGQETIFPIQYGQSVSVLRATPSLTIFLSHDIAVLEGGYSIEKALPYVNMGIILAMAGLDYSQVKEPEFDPSRFGNRNISRYIAQEADEIYELWSRREAIREKSVGNSKYIGRKRNIYYDTDGIREQQEVVVRVCNECGGMVTIDSRSDLGYRIFAVTIPWKACRECRQEGEDAYEKAQKEGRYQYVYLQDKENDLFLVK